MATAMALTTATAEAYEGLWCLRYSIGRGSAERCSFQTFEACRDERSLYGSTAFCSQNRATFRIGRAAASISNRAKRPARKNAPRARNSYSALAPKADIRR